MKKLKINLKKSKIKIVIPNEYFSLLSLLEKNNIYIDYQCRIGLCGICKTDILKGKVKYTSEPLAFFIPDKEILPCCCKAKKSIILNL